MVFWGHNAVASNKQFNQDAVAIGLYYLCKRYNVNLKTSKINYASVLALANVEALASEGGVDPNVCYNCKMKDYKDKNGAIYKSCCETDQQGNECNYKQEKNC